MTTPADLQAIREHKRGGYAVRTRHVDAHGEPRYTNHLIGEDSPYLLQHAHNPVDWYPWGAEAFTKAEREDKPVFLSIGYSTCHWCHVMEEESFDDETVAATLNRDFVAIKVDREQHPDLDELYMTGVQLVSGRGGWPMSSFLLADGRPFFGATYFPREQFLGLLEQVTQVWRDQRERIERDAETLDQGIRRQLAPSAAAELPDGLIDKVVDTLVGHADPVFGGFGQAPKFPQEPNLMLLAEIARRDTRPLAEQPAWSALGQALDALMRGGIFDQIGGGFHRYATDNAWQVPHFEKMLYNQGQLAQVFLAGWQLSGEPEYRTTVERTLDYLIREMRAPSGGFYSATDADSDGEEGRFFVWRHDELAAALDADDLALCETVFGVTRQGNFEGANVLHRPQSLDAAAERLGLDRAPLDRRLADIRERLYAIRAKRAAPLRDDKQITEWNGMAVVALARAGAAFARDDYLEAATDAAAHLWQVHHDEGRAMLWRTSLNGDASIAARIEDYAHFIDGLIALYDATGKAHWLERARILLAEARQRHWDTSAGGFFIAPPPTDGPQLMRSKSLMDGATVSGNSLMLGVLIALHERTGDTTLRGLAEAQIAAFSGHIAELPLAGPVFLIGLSQWHAPTPAPLQYLADGAIRAQCCLRALDEATRRATVTLDIRPGWHLQPGGDEPTATRLTRAEGCAGEVVNSDVVAAEGGGPGLYATVDLTLDVRGDGWPLVLDLQLQPCTQAECLPVVHRSFVLHGPVRSGQESGL